MRNLQEIQDHLDHCEACALQRQPAVAILLEDLVESIYKIKEQDAELKRLERVSTDNGILTIRVDELQNKLAAQAETIERLRELTRECHRYIKASPVPSDLWASGLCRELDEVLKGPIGAAESKGPE